MNDDFHELRERIAKKWRERVAKDPDARARAEEAAGIAASSLVPLADGYGAGKNIEGTIAFAKDIVLAYLGSGLGVSGRETGLALGRIAKWAAQRGEELAKDDEPHEEP